MATSKNRAFCEHCRHMVDVSLVSDKESVELKGARYVYPVRYGICEECGERATPDEVLEANHESFLHVVRESNGIVSQEIIKRIPERYNIGKRPLSKVLGWGEQSYSRFIDGDVPSREYSKTIERIDKSPLAFLILLYSNVNMLTDIAFRKSKEAALDALVEKGAAVERVAAFILASTGSTSPLALQKELYYANGMSLAFFGSPLFTTRCEAWVRGPVFPEVWENLQLKNAREESFFGAEIADAVAKTFSTEDMRILDAIVSRVACYSPFVLQEFTHHEEPWISAREGVPDGEPSQHEIPLDSISSYFLTIKKRYGMERPEDIALYMHDMLEKLINNRMQ